MIYQPKRKISDSQSEEIQFPVSMINGAVDKTAPSITGAMKGGAIDVHPENGGTIIGYYTNDLAYLTQRGGSFIMTNTTTSSTIASYGSGSSGAPAHNMFDGSPSYYNGWKLNATSDIITIIIKSPTAYSYSTQCGIGFGAATWRAKNIKIEFGYSATNKGTAQSPDSDIAWVTRINITNQSNGLVFGAGGGPNASQGGVAAGTWQYLRLTLTNWNGTSPRIAQIFTINYGSKGLHNTFLSLNGGRVYGTINANALQVGGKNAIVSGASTTSKTTGITAKSSAPSFTATSHKHTYSKAKFVFNTSTRDLTIGFDTVDSSTTTAGGTVGAPTITITDPGHTHTV